MLCVRYLGFLVGFYCLNRQMVSRACLIGGIGEFTCICLDCLDMLLQIFFLLVLVSLLLLIAEKVKEELG